jgi:hypothetical protein
VPESEWERQAKYPPEPRDRASRASRAARLPESTKILARRAPRPWRAALRAARQGFRFRQIQNGPKMVQKWSNFCLIFSSLQARSLSIFGEEWDDARAQFTANARKRGYLERIFFFSLGNFW